MKVLPSSLALMLVLATGACQKGAAAQVTQGVPAEEPVAVEPSPFLTIGTTDGSPATEFFGSIHPFPLPQGQIAIAFLAAGEIRLFDSNGRFLRSFGRPGEGPGEFRDLAGAWTRGGNVEAYDRRLRRITRFLPDGMVETVALHTGDSGFSPSGVVPGTLADGWLMLSGAAPPQPHGRIEVSVGHFSGDGVFRRVLVRSGGPEVYSFMRVHGPVPLSPNQVVLIHRDRLYFGDSASPEIRVITESGEVERVVRWESTGISPKEAQQAVVRLAVDEAAPEAKASLRQRLEAAPEAMSVPSFSTFLVDELGYMWVRPFVPLRDAMVLGRTPLGVPGGEWWIFDPEGKRLGAIELPSDLSPRYVTADAVVGVRQDDIGFRYVEAHRLVRRASTSSGQVIR